MYRNYTDDNFIRVYNDMVSENSERKLTIEELYVYCVLSESRNADIEMSMTVNVNLIHYRMPIKFVKKESENKKKIREAIKALVDKEYLIIVDNDINTTDITNNTFFTAVVNPELEGFTQIFFNEYRMMNSPEDLYVFAVTKRFSDMPDSKGYKASYNRWAKVLGVSDKTAQKIVNDAEVKTKIVDGVKHQTGVIHIFRGRYTDKSNQEINLYRHVSFMKPKEKQSTQKEQQTEQKQPHEVESTVKDKVAIAFGESPTLDSSTDNRNEQGQRTGTFEELFGDLEEKATPF